MTTSADQLDDDGGQSGDDVSKVRSISKQQLLQMSKLQQKCYWFFDEPTSALVSIQAPNVVGQY
jgi:hypothetical protein